MLAAPNIAAGRPGDVRAQRCWVLTGPTASGKTAVALAIGRHVALEVVSVDSMQIYRGMDIGTAKPSRAEREQVPHHLIDVLDPWQPCNVARFCRLAQAAIREVRARGNRVLLVGGSPMYLKGLIWGLMGAPGRDPCVRERLEREAAQSGPRALHQRLTHLDPEAARRIHPNDVRRVVRALEVCELTGSRMSDGRMNFGGEPQLDVTMVGLYVPRRELYRRINDRIDGMVRCGLVEEVRALRDALGPQASQAIGYKELRSFLDGSRSLSQAVDLVKRRTRRYAKHQMTWFRHFAPLQWVDTTCSAGPAALAERCVSLFERAA
jgi:tRNA dimethylallyltransferase